VDDFVNAAAADPKVNFDRKNPPHSKPWDATPENVAKLKQRIAAFVTEATGGPKIRRKTWAASRLWVPSRVPRIL